MAQAFISEIVKFSLLSYCRLLVVAHVVNNLFVAFFYLIFHPSAWRTTNNVQMWAQDLNVQKSLRGTPTARKLLNWQPSPAQKKRDKARVRHSGEVTRI
jgi:hypothetical protein